MTFHRGYGAEHHCSCHKLMGDDFWFLPKGSCLFEDGKGCDERVDEPTVAHLIEAAHEPSGEIDPIRMGRMG